MSNEEGVARFGAGMTAVHVEADLASKRWLGRRLGVDALPSHQLMGDGFVRLVDKTALEYQAARDRMIAFLADGKDADHRRAADHFESAVNSLHRAMAFLERLRRRGFRTPDGAPFVPRPRDLEVLNSTARNCVRGMRDAFEHLDEQILDGRIPHDGQVMVHLQWDRAVFNGHVIEYAQFAEWVAQLHRFAAMLSRVQIVVG